MTNTNALPAIIQAPAPQAHPKQADNQIEAAVVKPCTL